MVVGKRKVLPGGLSAPILVPKTFRIAGKQKSFHDVDSYYDAVCDTKSKGRSFWWRRVRVVQREGTVKLQCKCCETLYSASNPSAVFANHFVELEDGRYTCQVEESKRTRIEERIRAGDPDGEHLFIFTSKPTCN